MEITLQTFLLPQRLESLPVKNTVERPEVLVLTLTLGQAREPLHEPFTIFNLLTTE
jgi:hypothetical protein